MASWLNVRKILILSKDKHFSWDFSKVTTAFAFLLPFFYITQLLCTPTESEHFEIFGAHILFVNWKFCSESREFLQSKKKTVRRLGMTLDQVTLVCAHTHITLARQNLIIL